MENPKKIPGGNLSAKRVIVLDDEADVGETIALVVRAARYDVLYFKDPLAFLAALPAMDPLPSLLITDYRMPGMTGLEVIQRAKSLLPNLKSISVSGALPVQELSRQAHVPDALLPKPFQSRELMDLVKWLLADA
jgi:CheY-like chemotaxis protein